MQIAACVSKELFQKYNNVPKEFESTTQSLNEKKARQKMIEEAKQNNALIGAIIGGLQ